jgi:putative endonuclease
MFFVYILEAIESKRYYIGQTENLQGRLKMHNQGRNLSTKHYIPWQLKWWKECETRSEAIRIEKTLKGIKRRVVLEKYVRVNGFSGCGAVG